MTPEKSGSSNNGETSNQSITRGYFEIIRFLLVAFPLLAVVLIAASHAWDTASDTTDCSFFSEMLAFMGTAVRWYCGLVAVVIVAVPRFLARR